jgi:hypothetical protein
MSSAANSNREEFLEKAIALAPAGVIALLIGAPQSRPKLQVGLKDILKLFS